MENQFKTSKTSTIKTSSSFKFKVRRIDDYWFSRDSAMNAMCYTQ